VDLRYENQVVLEMASGKETAEAPPGETGSGAAVQGAPQGQRRRETKPAASAKAGSTKTAGKSTAKKSKQALSKKHGAVEQKRAAEAKATKRNSAKTFRPAARAVAAGETQGG